MNPKTLETIHQIRDLLAGLEVADSVSVITMLNIAAISSLEMSMETTGLKPTDDDLSFIDEYFAHSAQATKDQVLRLRASLASGELVLPPVSFDAVA